MTSSVPNGFSLDELQRMLAEARPEPAEEASVDNTIDAKAPDYEDRIVACANKYLDLATDEIKDPMVHKLMIILAVNNFIDFHNTVADKIRAEQEECSAGWSRDAGKFQAILNILATIDCGENDFTCLSD